MNHQSIYKIFSVIVFSLLWMVSVQSISGQCEFTVGTTGENTDFIQMLVLAESNGNIIEVINGSSGTFTTPLIGSYNVHALNYDPNNPPEPLPTIGGTITNVGSVGGCFNSTNFANDIKPIECLCSADDVTASFTPQIGFGLIYALADETGLILAVNTTGGFTASNGLADDTFVHALHYDLNNPPSPLPTIGGNVSEVGTIINGCFNNEFVGNPLCILVSQSPETQAVNIIRVCVGNAIFASLDGVNPMEATNSTFTWSLDGVPIATIMDSPYFSPSITGNYTVAITNLADCSSYVGDLPFEVTEIIDCQDCD